MVYHYTAIHDGVPIYYSFEFRILTEELTNQSFSKPTRKNFAAMRQKAVLREGISTNVSVTSMRDFFKSKKPKPRESVSGLSV